jgi:putative SOS response-associated peptidase YedK
MKDGSLFAFAGLWERWKDQDDSEAPVIQSCKIITTEANDAVRSVHNRMPVILPPSDFAAWLDPQTQPAELHPLLKPYPDAEKIGRQVSIYVYNARHEGPQCLGS